MSLVDIVLGNPDSKGAESICIFGGMAGSHRLSVLEALEGLSGKEWPNHPRGTGPEAPFILGKDVQDPSRSQWAFVSDALRMEKV